MKFKDVKVGDELVISTIGRNLDYTLKEPYTAKVYKVTKNRIYLNRTNFNWDEDYKFDFNGDYISALGAYKLHLNMDDAYDVFNRIEIEKSIYCIKDSYKHEFTLDQLRRIKAIVEEPK